MKKRLKKLSLTLAILTGLVPPAVSMAQADNFPSKPITYIVPFAPGGASDIGGRILSEALSKELKQSVVVENKSGAAGTIGLGQLIRSAPDGHYISIVVAPNLVTPLLMPAPPYDLTKDVKPLGMIYETPTVLVVNPKYQPKITSLDSLIATAKENKHGLNFATSGVGSTAHLTMAKLAKDNKVNFEHIPFRGSSPAITAVLAGEIDFLYSEVLSLLPHIQNGSLRPIMVGTVKRLESLPDVPSIKEQNINMDTRTSWTGLVVPKDTPDAIVTKLATAVEKVMNSEDIQKRFKDLGAIPEYRNPQIMQERIAGDSAFWGQIIKDNNIQQNN